MKYSLYLVGGIIRDELLGVKSKDYDYTVVIENFEDYKTPLDAYNDFDKEIVKQGYEVFVRTPDMLTIRARFPKDHKLVGQTADFVLARKELGYIKGTREPKVVLGTLEDDLWRRDFTINSLAMDEDGNIVDMFKGQEDLLDGIIRTNSDASISFNRDPLRILRALRFMITKDLELSDEIWKALDVFDAKKLRVVSVERKMTELEKMFRHDTMRTMQILKTIDLYNSDLFSAIMEGFWLLPTNKK